MQTTATLKPIPAEAPGGPPLPDPAELLERLEGHLSAGLSLDRVVKHGGIKEDLLREMLSTPRAERSQIGVSKGFFKNIGGHGWQERGLVIAQESLSRLRTYLEEYETVQAENKGGYVDTPTGVILRGIARNTLENRRLALITSDYGIGKTMEMERFAKSRPMTPDSPGVVYITLTDDMRQPARLYQAISDAIRLGERASARGVSLANRVRDALRPGDMLILDEGNYLFDFALWPAVRDIYDASPAAVLIVSNPIGVDAIGKNEAAMGAFLSRLKWWRIGKSQAGDAEALMLAKGYTGEALVKEAVRIATAGGWSSGLRGLLDALGEAESRARQGNLPLNAKMLKLVAESRAIFRGKK